MQHHPGRVCWQQPQRPMRRVRREPRLLGQTDRRQTALLATPLVRCDRRPLGRRLQLARPRDRLAHLRTKRLIDRHPHRQLARVVAHPRLGDRSPKRLLDQQHVRPTLDPIAIPCALLRRRPTHLVLVHDQRAVPMPQQVERPLDPQRRALEAQALDRARLRIQILDMRAPARIDPVVRHSQALDLFQEEEARAVDERVQPGHRHQAPVHVTRPSARLGPTRWPARGPNRPARKAETPSGSHHLGRCSS